MRNVVYTYKALGESIALLCDTSDITIKELCANCEISKRTYYQVISDEMLAYAITSESFIIYTKIRVELSISNAVLP